MLQDFYNNELKELQDGHPAQTKEADQEFINDFESKISISNKSESRIERDDGEEDLQQADLREFNDGKHVIPQFSKQVKVSFQETPDLGKRGLSLSVRVSDKGD